MYTFIKNPSQDVITGYNYSFIFIKINVMIKGKIHVAENETPLTALHFLNEVFKKHIDPNLTF
jgi:hypothetical protein